MIIKEVLGFVTIWQITNTNRLEIILYLNSQQNQSSLSAVSSDTYCWVDMSNLGSPPNVDFIFIFFFCCLPIYWIIKIHTFSILPFPVSPDEVSPHAQQANDH